MKVTLIRHTSVNVEKGTCYGWSDVPVAATFEQEAAVTKAALEGKTFDIVYTSPLSRARLLAAFCGFPYAVTDDRLKEMNMGDWEMRKYDNINDPNLQAWYDDYIHLAATNGESFTMLYHRVKAFLDELKASSRSSAAIFAHGGVLLCAGLYAGLYTTERLFDNLTPYGGILEINI